MSAAALIGHVHRSLLLSADGRRSAPTMRAKYRPYPAGFFHPRMEFSTGPTLVAPRGGGSGVNLGFSASARSRSRRNSSMRVRMVAVVGSTRSLHEFLPSVRSNFGGALGPWARGRRKTILSW